MRITDQLIDQAFADGKATCGGVRNDYFGCFQFKYSESHQPFKSTFQRLIDAGMQYRFDAVGQDRQ